MNEPHKRSIDLRPGDALRLRVGNTITSLRLEHKSGQLARLEVQADTSVAIQHERKRVDRSNPCMA